MDKTIEEAVEYLKEQGVTIDLKTQKQSEGKINGMEGIDITRTGKVAAIGTSHGGHDEPPRIRTL
jgi:hypothetical protein